MIPENILDTPIAVIGAGAIGSFTVLTLAKMGFQRIVVFDDDVVSEENLPNQFYRTCDIGKPKVQALAQIVREFEGLHLRTYSTRVAMEQGWELRDVVISAVDSMLSRQMVFEMFKEASAGLLIDGRMGGDQAEVYSCIKPALDVYQSRLWSEGETADVRCTSKATMYNVLCISSLICNMVRKHLKQEAIPEAVIMDNFNITMYKPEGIAC